MNDYWRLRMRTYRYPGAPKKFLRGATFKTKAPFRWEEKFQLRSISLPVEKNLGAAKFSRNFVDD